MHLSACKGLSQPEIDIGRVMNVKTEVMEPALHIKHEPDLDGAVPSSYVMPVENGAEPPGTEETVVEVGVLLFRASGVLFTDGHSCACATR